jgi:Mg-chelatase subunit ChlD
MHLKKNHAARKTRQPNNRGLIISDVKRVRIASEQLRLPLDLGRIRALRRPNLSGDNETPLRKNLMQFKLEGKEKEGKGPLIVCIDNSGSMAGEREEWAKGFALGLLTIAKKQKREFCIIHFSD